MSLEDVVTVISCIIPRRGLSMGLTLCLPDDNFDDDDSDSLIQDLSPLSSFFKQFHVTRLFLNADLVTGGINLDTALDSLGDPLPSLEELALDGDLLVDNHVTGSLLVGHFPRLHTLHIIGKTVPVARLKAMLVSSSVQTVRFRWKKRHPSKVLQTISKAVPSVSYSLYNTLMDDQPFPWDLPFASYSENGASCPTVCAS